AGVRGLGPARRAVLRALEQGKPALGICLGMQLLFDGSDEGPGRGLGFIPGRVATLPHKLLPQVGWNEVHTSDDPLFEGVAPEFHGYYVNTFAPVPKARSGIIARTTYGKPFVAGVRRLNTWGLQFHPEKSSRAGLRIVQNFVGLAEACA
ncbi:MAG TPA: imidazole glycerol phosphate synthase subunit HisH, partial [Candidatus Thermoplasmatota archaeon]|nr:imidazole glycerol phosphate synthase subunit HisH [Candidatus Thermoplasmatota archaeon]